MFKLGIFGLLIILFTACGLDTASSTPAVEEVNEPTVEEPIVINIKDLDLINQDIIDNNLDNSGNLDVIDPNPIGGLDPNPIDPNPIDPNPIDPDPIDPDPIDPDQDDNETEEPDTGVIVPNDGSVSDFDTEGAIEDKFACIVGDSNEGYTNNTVTDSSIDNRGAMDEEDGVGINSLLAYNNDVDETKIMVYYYDLKPARTMDVTSVYETSYRFDIDTGWADNDETFVYVQLPRDENGLYRCYRYELSSINVNNTLDSVKVYRKKI